jgi:hypothetical protein
MVLKMLAMVQIQVDPMLEKTLSFLEEVVRLNK